MIKEINENSKIIFYWLTQKERNDDNLQQDLNKKYDEHKSKGYKVCTFVSGDGNLLDNTKNLLLHNREIIAEQSFGDNSSLNAD